MIHPPKIPTKSEYQRQLHESYQFIMKLIVEQQIVNKFEEDRRKGEQDDKKKNNDKEDLLANVKKARDKMKRNIQAP